MRGRGLTDEEREEISRGIAAGESGRDVAARLGRHYSVVNREVARCGGREGYRSAAAAVLRVARARRPKIQRLAAEPRLHDAVAAGLTEAWSPRQISARLRREHPNDEAMRVSHETIYQTLFCQARGELNTQLKLALRTGRTRRVARGSTRPKQARIAGMVNISERPAEAADRAVPGHWEGDLIIGAGGKSQIITLVERTTGYLLLGRVPYDRTADRVGLILGTLVPRLPQQLWRSLTWDQGVEMAAHATFSVRTGVPVFFADPHSPWQRGSNENTNGLLRQYFPKGTDLSPHTQASLDAVAVQLNGRPRQRHNWKTPAEELDLILSAAA